MEIFICRGYSGQIFRVNINETYPLSEVKGIMANAVGFYSSNEEELGVYNLTRDFEYADNRTLLECGTQEGDLILIADGGKGCSHA